MSPKYIDEAGLFQFLMKPHPLPLVLLLAALLPACLTARLGDTELQCESRYGKPISAPTATLTTAPFTRRYKFDEWVIEATFVNRRVAKQSYCWDWTIPHTGEPTAAYPAILHSS